MHDVFYHHLSVLVVLGIVSTNPSHVIGRCPGLYSVAFGKVDAVGLSHRIVIR